MEALILIAIIIVIDLLVTPRSKNTERQPTEEERRQHPRAGDRWTWVEERWLAQLYRREGRSVEEISGMLKRSPNAIRIRLSDLRIPQSD